MVDSWFEYFRKSRRMLLLGILCAGILGTVFILYDLPAEPMIYGAVLCSAAGLASFFYGHSAYVKKKQRLEDVLHSLPAGLDQFPETEDELEKLYREVIFELNRQRMASENNRQRFYEEITDYYGMWVHQIKTPISAMRLLLQEKGDDAKSELGELFKIEQYVEMVLGYLRTEDMSGDMAFCACSLDKIIREQIHKYARIFIGKKLALFYDGVDETVLTDEKWLGFVIGQVLSNALKYTKKGSISIYMSRERPLTLVIEDTGIGISAQDIPRVFEKGFTGYNGRGENPSSGIGLYLSAKIMRKLGNKIYIESEQGKGTRVFLELKKEELEMYS